QKNNSPTYGATVIFWLREKDLNLRPSGYHFVPTCGSRKIASGFRFPRIFRPLQKLWLCSSCHRQRKTTIPNELARQSHNPTIHFFSDKKITAPPMVRLLFSGCGRRT
ncbi:MAG: hypothetical protein IKM15_04705, partial [Peptococcaceae bacterium]|nr:hypothetical protein [Peptococcaceae bacterium]